MRTDAIRRITIEGRTTGVNEATASLTALSRAQTNVAQAAEGVAVATDSSARRQLSAAKAYESVRQRVDESYRAQVQQQKMMQTVQRAFDQGSISAAEFAKTSAQVAESFKKQGAAANDNNRALAGVGAALGQIHPAFGMLSSGGLTVAAVLGGAALAIRAVAGASLALADRAGNIKDFSETTGFTVMQLQALEKAGAQVGVSGEKVSRGLERFSVSMDDLKKGVGGAFESILEINPALAKQFTQVNDLSDAWDLFSKAIKAADLEQANKLARAVFGREGVPITRLLKANDDAGGIAGLVKDLEKVGYITAQQADQWDTLGDSINEAMKTARQNITAIFTGAILQMMNSLATAFRDFSVAVRNFTIGEDFKKFLEWSKSPAGMAIMAGGAGAMLGGMVAGPVGAIVGGLGMGGLGAWKGYSDQGKTTALPPITVPSPGGGSGAGAAAAAAAASSKALEDQKRSLTASIAEQERYNAVAGAAVTPAENLRLGMDKLKLAFLEGKVSAEQMEKAQGGLNAQFSSQKFAGYLALLGQSATVEEQVLGKKNAINDAARQNIHLTTEQIATQIRLAREQALGTSQIKASTDALIAEAQSIGMSTGAAAAHMAAQNALNEAKRNGKVLTQDNVAEIYREAEAMGRAVQSVEGLRAAQSEFRSLFSSFGQYMRQGESAWNAFKHAGMDALGRISDKLMSMVADNLFNAAFGGAKSGGAGGLIGMLFGLGNGGGTGIGPMPDGSVMSWATGGYTGAGGKYQPAGIVHAGEYVFSQSSVNRLGVGNLDRLHRSSLPGYSAGGFVRPASNDNPITFGDVNVTFQASGDAGEDAKSMAQMRREITAIRSEQIRQARGIQSAQRMQMTGVG